jgi:hypothetical protein
MCVYLKEKIEATEDVCCNGYEANTSILDTLILQAWSHGAYGPPSKYFNNHAQETAFLLLASLHNLRGFTFNPSSQICMLFLYLYILER